MADTRILKTKIEPDVRGWLSKKLGKPFRSEFLIPSRVKDKLARHEFDALSEERTVVCAIETASWNTSSGKPRDGRFHGAYAEIHFLDHVGHCLLGMIRRPTVPKLYPIRAFPAAGAAGA